MAEYISGELWYCIASSNQNFYIWNTLLAAIPVFWRYVRKIGRYKLTEKLFGRILLENYGNIVIWKIREMNWRANGLPFYVNSFDSIGWMKRGKKPTDIHSDGSMEFRLNDLFRLGSHGGYYHNNKIIYFVYNDGTMVYCRYIDVCIESVAVVRTGFMIYTRGDVYSCNHRNRNIPNRIMFDGRFVYHSI